MFWILTSALVRDERFSIDHIHDFLNQQKIEADR
jgi:hypothetical protein